MTAGQIRIAKILCRRDDVTMEHAESIINDVIEQMEACNYDPMECEDIVADELGLEPDYVIDLLL